MAKRLSVAVFGLIIFTGLFWGCGEGGQSADLILLNGKVYTLSWDEPVLDGTPARNAPFRRGRWEQDAEAVAVKDGKIMYVGSSRRARRFQAKGTRVLDIEGCHTASRAC